MASGDCISLLVSIRNGLTESAQSLGAARISDAGKNAIIGMIAVNNNDHKTIAALFRRDGRYEGWVAALETVVASIDAIILEYSQE